MEIRIVTKKYGRSPLDKALCKLELEEFARRVIRGTEQSEGAKLELLFSLPGIFAMELLYCGASVRLIKEGDVFRVMEKSEKSDVLLCVRVTDKAALADLYFHNATWQKVYAEGRLVFAGKVKYASLLMRIIAACEKDCLPPQKIHELYGE